MSEVDTNYQTTGRKDAIVYSSRKWWIFVWVLDGKDATIVWLGHVSVPQSMRNNEQNRTMFKIG